MPKPEITLCMIARDEIRCIGDAIRSCAGVVEDVVVVDTGSTDGTPDLAGSLGARVFHQPWEDSFSKPRNFGLDQVRTKWVLVLDCDDKLRAGSGPLVIDACRSNAAEGFTVSYMVHSPTGPTPTRVLRLGRADMGFRFRNRIHERIVADPNAVAIATQIVIDHFGYLYKPRHAKADLYNRLLQMDLEDRPTDN
jgi:glycosyltransferase involved in cell wall biosynthesis